MVLFKTHLLLTLISLSTNVGQGEKRGWTPLKGSPYMPFLPLPPHSACLSLAELGIADVESAFPSSVAAACFQQTASKDPLPMEEMPFQ